jgi:hypothetical protein
LGKVDAMSEPDKISAVLHLRCPNHHDLGNLLTHRYGGGITYAGRDWAPMIHEGFFSLPVCPGGCQYEVVEIPEKLEAKLRELADDRERDEETYDLRFLGPCWETND